MSEPSLYVLSPVSSFTRFYSGAGSINESLEVRDMITVIVTFSIPSEVSASVLEEKFLETAPMYLETSGLVRINYPYDRATLEAGGCYTFQDKKSAELWFNEERI